MSRVLVVVDDDTICDTLYELLSEQYVCQTAETAEKGGSQTRSRRVRSGV